MGRPKKATPSVEKAPSRLAGAFDFLPEHHLSWEVFMEKLTSLAHNFGYGKVDGPMFEDSRLFSFWSQDDDQLLENGRLRSARPRAEASIGTRYARSSQRAGRSPAAAGAAPFRMSYRWLGAVAARRRLRACGGRTP